jgi:hypothetical protein
MEEVIGDERGADDARRLLHELVNDLATIQIRANLLLGMDCISDSPTSAPVRSDLVAIRSTAAHAIALAEHFGVTLTRTERPAIDGSDV